MRKPEQRVEFAEKPCKVRSVQFLDASESTPQIQHTDDEDLTESQAGDESVFSETSSDVSTSQAHRRKRFVLASRLKLCLIVIYGLLTVIVPLIVCVTVYKAQVDNFEAEFDSLSGRIVSDFQIRLGSIFHSLAAISIEATSNAIDSNASWPFFLLRDFDLLGAGTLALSEGLVVSLNVLVANDTRSAWEHFTQENIGWLTSSLQLEDSVADENVGLRYLAEDPDLAIARSASPYQEMQRDLIAADESLMGFSDQIFRFDPNEPGKIAIEDSPGPFLPSWQSFPFDPASVNYNLLSYEPDHEAILTMLETGDMIISRPRTVIGRSDDDIPHYSISEIHSDQRSETQTSTEVVGEAISNVYFPVFDSFEVGRRIVAMYSLTVPWKRLLSGTLSSGSNGIVCVVGNTCGDAFTYEIIGAEAYFLGFGDQHDPEFDSSEVEFDFFVAEQSDQFRFSSPELPLSQRFCPSTLRIYPTYKLWGAHVTMASIILTAIVALFSLVVGLMAFLYDHIREQRVEAISKTEVRARHLVESHFPDEIRQRLMGTAKDGLMEYCTTSHPKTRLKSFLSNAPIVETDDSHKHPVDDDLLFLNTKPMADLFLHCTVLFANICGFSAWSSEREPEQVFTLLEAIFQELDKLARRRGVFKVETIGDCYVAVTGLPDPQADHAVRMTAFARTALGRVARTTKKLEVTLGPGTGDLRLRFGLNSGPVTAGVLRGQRSRFQLFGDTINMASRMESTSHPNRIQLSMSTSDQLIKAGRSAWIQLRRDSVNIKGKGVVHTYWAVHGRADAFSDHSAVTSDGSDQDQLDDASEVDFFDAGDLWDDDEMGRLSLPVLSKISKNKRLIDWQVELLLVQLKKVVADRQSRPVRKAAAKDAAPFVEGTSVLDEVVEAFTLPKLDKRRIKKRIDPEVVDIAPEVVAQLHDYVEAIASRYRDNAFHNFEHACHVTMAVVKLLNRIVVPDEVNYRMSSAKVIASDIHEFTYGITSDALAQFAVTLSALIHDVDHTGVSNGQLSKENPDMGSKYNFRSVAEQNSFDLAWDLLMDDHYKDLQQCIFCDDVELKRFRQYIVNLVMATDIFDNEMKALRNQRWDKAFAVDAASSIAGGTDDTDSQKTGLVSFAEESNLKATIVIEHIIQASDVSHTMQHWNVYKKWNERLFQEMYAAFEHGRADKDPSEGWYHGELWFFDNYIIPLAKKLEECRVFGVSSDECLNYAKLNREEWEKNGKDVVNEMVQRYKKRKKLEVGGFTPDEINSFTASELEQILQLLIKKGRAFGSMKGCDKSGQRNAAQAWLDALEIFERAPASFGLKDRTMIFPIFSGLHAFLKGGKILQDDDCTFEQNLALMFVKETDEHGDPVHYTRALAMLCEVNFRAFKLDAAFEAFEHIVALYDPRKHSEAICKAYGTDRTVHAFSQSALWYHQMGDDENACKACEHVIDNILPLMDPKNILNTCEILWPIMRVEKMKGEEKRMRDLFDAHVVQNFYKHELKFTPCMPVFKPLLMLFDMCIDPESCSFAQDFQADVVDYLLGDSAVTFDDFLDHMYVKLGWAPNSIWAELYLRVSKKVYADGGNPETVCALVKRGIVASRSCEWKMWKPRTHSEKGIDKGDTGSDNNNGRKDDLALPLAYEIQAPITRQLLELASCLGIKEEDMVEVKSSSSSQHQVPLSTSLGLIELCD